MFKCKYCDKEFERGNQVGGHQVVCSKNPNSKKTRERISESQRGSKNSMSNLETRRKISNSIKEKIKKGEWHLSFSKSRTHEYKGEKLYGKWELEYAKFLDANNISWRRPKEKFPYEFEGKKGYYTPDFFLIEEQQYVEIKGYPTEKDFAKWNSFPFDLQIITGKMLVEMDVIETYKSRNVSYKQYSWK